MKLGNNQRLKEIRQKYALALILLHGSQVSGQIHAKSDVDIAVLSQVRGQTLDRLALIVDLNDALESQAVDLTVLDYADPLLLKTVADKAQLLAGIAIDLFKLRLRAFHAYNNYLPYLKMEADFVRSQL